MSSLPPPEDITKRKHYAVAILLAVLLAVLAQALVIPSSWLKSWMTKSQNQEPTTPSVIQKNVCGVWRSLSSEKRYEFVCQGQNSFDIYTVIGQGLTKTGSGMITEEGNVEADILLSHINRTAHLRLKLSPDGQKMEGAFHGEDPREYGLLVFHRISP